MIGVPTIVVAAAVIERDGCFLVTRRVRGAHLEGYWEFPGGKCETGETHAACLVREIREELGVEIAVGDEVFATTHDYPERRVELHFLRGNIFGTPTPQMGQEMRWVPRDDLASLPFPPADAELIRVLATENSEKQSRQTE
ncbi:MAG: (deoxy)nucleoside triphosphate pyrophosphohydrolase [Vicinamibacterales bacterium]